MIDFTLTEEQQAYRELARDFAAREITPIVKEREKIHDAAQRVPWDVIEKGSKLGLRTLTTPKKYGGPGVDCVTRCIVNEEMAVGDLGIATTFDQANRVAGRIFMCCDEGQYERHLKPVLANHRGLLAIGLTEPSSGSDGLLPYDAEGAGVQTFAERRDGHYVLNGRKQFITEGLEASLYMIVARTHRTKKFSEGALSAFLVPKGTPGFTIGVVWDKIGQKFHTNADLIFEDCRIPAEDILLGEGMYRTVQPKFARTANPEAAALSLGPGRAAYEAAVSWAQQRVQGGKPIIDHQAIQMMLADMAIKIETARVITWKAAWAAEHQDPLDFRLPSISKAYASEVAFDVCRLAMEIHGGYGIMKDLLLEKYLRDASTMLHSDGTNQIHRLKIANRIKQGMVG